MYYFVNFYLIIFYKYYLKSIYLKLSGKYGFIDFNILYIFQFKKLKNGFIKNNLYNNFFLKI